MNSSETQETPANASPAPAEPTNAEPANEAKHEPSAAAPPAGAPSGTSAHADDNDADDGDGDAEGEGDAAAGGAPAADGTPGDPTKKKRRRRRRKKHGATPEGATASGEGAPAEAGEAGAAEGATATNGEAKKNDARKKNDRGDKKKGGKPHHDPHRERPAFAVGDVVFGKILDIGEDAIFVDVAGKAKAVFDKLELLLPEDMADTVEEDARKGEAEAEAIMRGGKAAAEGEEAAAEDATAEKTEAAPAETTAQVEAAPPPAASGPAAAAAEGESTEAAPAAEGEAAAAPAEEAKPGIVQLPRVVLEAGATFVGVVHNDGGRGGMVVLTHHPKRAGKAKPAVAAAFKNKTEIFGLVTGVIKGGVEVDVDGLRAFAPGSHMSLHLGHDLHHLVGKRLPFSVTQYAKRGRDVVLSRKAVLEVEAKAARELALSKVKPGDTVEGTVRSVVAFGAFVDIGGVEGLVSLSEMSHNRSDSPSDVFKVGKKTNVLIQKIDDKGKIWLSHKATIPDPWGDVATKYAVGTKHTGKVVRIQPFGAFLELESGVDGLIHTSDLFGLPAKEGYVKPVVEKPVEKPVERNDRRPGGDKRGDRGDRGASSSSSSRIDHPNEFVAIGDTLEVVVSSLDTGTHKIALHPAPTGDAANEAPQRVQLHKMVKVVVVAAEATGLVVRVLGATGRNSRGYITGAATGTPRGTELRKIFPVGKELEAKVIEIDPRRGEAKLSLKAVQQDTERNAYQQYRQQVKREAKFGTFGDLLQQASAKKNPQK